jgi:hypothetical protein
LQLWYWGTIQRGWKIGVWCIYIEGRRLEHLIFFKKKLAS